MSLRELNNVSQVCGEPVRRIFKGEELELTVWFEREHIHAFQLCYSQNRQQKSLTWRRDGGFEHRRVDDGEGRLFRHKMSPVLVPDGTLDKDEVIRLFREQSSSIELPIAQFVLTRIAEFT